ncbi:unnamed protein product [Echinostoma caproni]|uniref:CNH domain-containing protein n=1 Tax=Echinostoma caproni TaxID=27848 RepID=A0A183BB97_9TREM|nr:unnamed protein product [Echinostoma caproni]
MNLDLPERVYCADVHYPLAIVGLANRQVIAYNLENGPTEFTRIESPLKFQSRCVSIFLDKQKQQPNGFALGSIEGRVAIQYFSPTTPKENFTFKCHRSSAAVNGYHEIYAVTTNFSIYLHFSRSFLRLLMNRRLRDLRAVSNLASEGIFLRQCSMATKVKRIHHLCFDRAPKPTVFFLSTFGFLN